MPARGKATIRDVACQAGVSTATVSRVLSNHGPVSEDVRMRVQRAIDALGYRPNRIARDTRVQRSVDRNYEIKNINQYSLLAVGLKPSAIQGKARLRGLYRI